MKSILDDIHNILSANRKQVDSILMKAAIESKRIQLDIPKPTKNADIPASARSASVNSNNEVPYFLISTDLAGSKSKYAGSGIEKEQGIKLKSGSKSDPSAYLTIRKLKETGGYDDNKIDERDKVKSASANQKPDPTSFLIIDDYIQNRRSYQLKAEEEEQRQRVKSAKRSNDKKLAYLTIEEYKSTGGVR